MIRDCFTRYEDIAEDVDDTRDDNPIDYEDHTFLDDTDGIQEDEAMMDLLEQSQIPLFNGSKSNRLVSTLLLLHCFTVFGVSAAFADELLKMLVELLPEGNTLPGTH